MITEAGFQRPTRAELLARVKQKFITRFTTSEGGVTFAPSLEPEDEKGAEAEILTDLWDDFYQLAEALYYAKFLLTATGIQLDRAAAPTLRRQPSQADTTLEFTGEAGAIIPGGSVFETEDKRQYATQFALTLDEYGLGEVEALAVVAGVAGNAPEGAISFFAASISGVNTVTNSTPALNGLDVETDDDFRQRVLLDRAADRTSSLQAIVDAVAELENITAVKGFENTGNSIDADGLQPGAVEIVTRGGVDQDIAEAIFRVKGAGIGTHGDVDTTVVDREGATKHILHSHVTEVPIYVLYTLIVDSTFNPVTALPEIRQRCLDYIGGVNQDNVVSEGLDVGEDVAAWEIMSTLFEQAASKIPGIVKSTPPEVLIGTSSGDRTHESITITTRQKAITDFAKIDINYTS